ncbi:hypothetical protein QL285_028909 [Trifolium repens]|nr:hypothetical protein QL285_028909 [Trifolium repens]
MGACLSKKKTSSTSSHPLPSTKSLSTPPSDNTNVTVTLFKPETTLNNKNNNIVQEKQQNLEEVTKEHEEPKKEIFIIKHRKSHDEREKNNIKITPFIVQHNLPSQNIDGLVSSSETESLNNNNNSNKVGVAGVRTSSCTKEEVDAILIQCGRLSRSSSGKAASSSTRKYSGSKRSFDFDHCDNNDAISAEDEQKRVNASDNSEEYDGVARHNNRARHRNSPNPKSSNGRRRTPSRERDQRSSSRERRVSRSPGRRSSDTNGNGSNNGSGSVSGSGCTRPGKMVTVPATVTSLVMDKSNNGESVKRVNVKRNVASPRSMSPARGIGNGVNQQQQQNQPSLSRNSSARKTEVSPYRRNPLSDVDPNSLSYPQSNANNGGTKVQNKGKKEIEAETVQKPNVDMKDSKRNRTNNRVAIEKVVNVNCHTKEQQQEEEIKVMSDNAIVKNVVMPSGIIRSRSSRRSRDFDIITSAETPTNPPQTSYTSLLLEDIQNFHQKNTNTTQPSVSLPACLNKACSILEAVADLNSTTSSTFSNDKKIRNEYNNVVPESSFVESEIDVMEPSLHKYVTVKRGGSICGVIDMEDQESSGSNSFTVSSGQQQWNICSSGDSSECWSSRLNSKEDSLKRRECDHQHSGGIGRGRLATASI